MITIMDVANTAGVSRATASRVINGHDAVAPETARHVRRAMEQVGYVAEVTRTGPKPKARSTGKSARAVRTVGLLLMGRTRELLEQPSTRCALAGFTSAAQAADVRTTVLEMSDPAAIPPSVRDRALDGLLITGMQPRPEWVDIFHPIPIVVAGATAMPETCFDHVLVNNAETGRMAARYLLETGGRNLAYMNHDAAHESFVPRFQAFEQEAATASARVRVYETPTRDLSEADYWTTPRLRADFTELLDRMLADGGLPDGIYLPTDQQAAMLYTLLRERGIGEGVTTISCNNDAPWLATIHPRPATIDLRSEAIGRLALKQLLERIENPAADFAVTLVAPRLVRGETGRPAGRIR